MISYDKLFINGDWVAPRSGETIDVINPATEEPCARVAIANNDDVDAAVAAARAAFPAWSSSDSAYRAEMINKVADAMERRLDDLAEAHSVSMGIPRHLAPDYQVRGPIGAMRSFADRCQLMDEVEENEGFKVVREAAGVCVFINPWNYPLSQFVGKVAPALAAGCTMVVKPAEQTPLQDLIMAEIFAEVGLPAGVFNLIPGRGAEIGPHMTSHPQVDMVSFTGSTAAGVRIGESAAPSIKRVCLELGGKSPYIITEDADLEAAVKYGVDDVMYNSGQTCTALTRMLAPRSKLAEVEAIAKEHALSFKVGDPRDESVDMGPMSSAGQQATVLKYIRIGLEEGAELLTGGTDMPEGVDRGAYVRPTIFTKVDNSMRVAQEEIFGPVLCIIPYDDIDDAVRIANDTVYGLSSGVYAKDHDAALKIARQLRAGQCYTQGAGFNYQAPFGGYKQSGNGREWGDHGLMEFVETKSILL